MKFFSRVGFPILFFGLLSVLITWPLVRDFGTKIPIGTGGDAWVHQWTFWWMKKALSEGTNPLYTHMLFYPGGVSLTSHNVAWFNFALWYPLQAIWGNTIAYGLTFLMIFTLNGLCCYWLAQKLTGSVVASLAAGIIYQTWPYLTSQLGHPNMSIIMWMPLAILFLLRTFEEKRVRDALLTGLFIALTGTGRWQLLILFGIGFGLFFLYYFVTTKMYRTPRMLLLYGLIGVVAVVVMAPLGWPMLEAQLSRNNPDEVFVKEYFQGSDLLAYVIPNSFIAMWRWLVFLLPTSLQFHFDRVDFIGHMTLILAGAGVWLRWAKARPWVLMGLVYFILALGADFRFGNAIYSWVPMPYRWIEELSLIKVIRYPHRFNAFMSLPVAILAAYGMSELSTRLAPRIRSSLGRALVVGLVLALLVGEHWMVPYRLSTIDVPTWYQQLANEPEEFGLLGLPLDHRGRDKDYMRFQMIHGKPLAQGHISRPTSEAYALFQSTPLLTLLQENSQLDPHIGDVTHQLRVLADANIRYIILHKAYATEKEMVEWRAWLMVDPAYEDDEVVVYSTAPQYGIAYQLPEMITDEIGLFSTESNLAASEGRFPQGGTLQVTAEWGTLAEPSQALDACLYLDGQGELALEGESARACFALGTDWPTSQWSANELARDRYSYQMSPFITPGPYALTLGLEEANNRVGVPIDLGTIEVEALPRVMQAPSTEHPQAASWGGQLTLVGYDLATAEGSDTVQLSLVWQATQRMEHSYKFFVHVLDANGDKIAQHDGIPRNWSYPTTWWEAGEYVTDEISMTIDLGNSDQENTGQSIDLTQVELQIGVYDEVTGERLPGFSAQNEPLPEETLRIGAAGE